MITFSLIQLPNNYLILSELGENHKRSWKLKKLHMTQIMWDLMKMSKLSLFGLIAFTK